MKRLFSVFLVTMMLFCCSSMIAFGSSGSLDDVINENNTVVTEQVQPEQSTSGLSAEQKEKNKNFIAGLTDAADLSTEVEGVSEVTAGIKLVASWIVQVLSYAITALLVVRVVLDLAYIGIPFFRSFLANGYAGNPQAGAGGMPNSMMGGGMAGGMGGMGMGGPGMMGGMGMGGMGGSMYGRGGYGMNRGMGMMGGATGMAGQNAVGMNQSGSIMGRVQWVSNAALNAVAAESSVGPDGKAISPFKEYCKDMILVLVLVPILLTLAVTGTLTNLGFLIGDLLIDAIASIGDMI